MTKTKFFLLLAAGCFLLGVFLGMYIGHLLPYGKASQPSQILAQTTKTETSVVYEPKENGEKTDIEAKIGKQSLFLKINDVTTEIGKQHEERYVLDKNKLTLTQISSATIEIKPVDMTKHFGVGIGVSLSGIAALFMVPAGPVDAWIAGDRDHGAGGLLFRF